MTDNELTRLLQRAIDARYHSAEHLSVEAGLANGTVRNILTSGRASPRSLRALAPKVGKTVEEMYQAAGIMPAPKTKGMCRQAEEASEIVENAPEWAREVLLDALRVTARAAGLREPLTTDRSYLQKEDHREDQS